MPPGSCRAGSCPPRPLTQGKAGTPQHPHPCQGQTPPGQDQVPSETEQWGAPPPPSASPSPAHFFSFSPTAGDAAGLLSFSLGGDGE